MPSTPRQRRASLPLDARARLPMRRVRLSGGRVLDVRGTGDYTLYRHADPDAALSPYAGRWIVASPAFRAEIEAAEASH